MKVSLAAAIVFGPVVSPAFAAPGVKELEVEAAAPSVPEGGKQAEKDVILNVREDGSVYMGGKKLTLEELGGELKKFAEGQKDGKVRIQADADVAYTRITEVLDVCWKAGLPDLSFAGYAVAGEEGGDQLTERSYTMFESRVRTGEECEDKLTAVAEVVPDLADKLFDTAETTRQPWIVESSDGGLEDTMDGSIDSDDLLLVEKTANCTSTHQGEHAMEFCDAVKTEGGVEFELSGGAPAYVSSLAVTINAERQFTCTFKAVYPSSPAPLHWKVTKKAMKLKTEVGEPGSRLRGWISVEFDEIDDTAEVAKRYKIEGYFKPVIQSAAVEVEEDK